MSQQDKSPARSFTTAVASPRPLGAAAGRPSRPYRKQPPTSGAPCAVLDAPPTVDALPHVGSAKALDTLAQLVKVGNEAKLEGWQGTSEELAEQLSKLQKRAKAKYISVPISIKLAELRTELEQSYRNAYYCCGVIRQEDGRLTTRYCGTRWCYVCNRIRMGRAINAYLPLIEELEEARFVTLTVSNCKADELPRVIAGMLAAFTSAKKKLKRAGLSVDAIRKLECTYSVVRKDFHPHFHVLLDGEAAAHALVDAWQQFAPKKTGQRVELIGQDVRPVDLNSAKELFKYFSKLTAKTTNEVGESVNVPVPAEALDVIFCAMRGRRVYQPLGALFNRIREEGDPDAEELTDLEGGPAVSRFGESVLWMWEQQCNDWVDLTTGDTLTGYEPEESEAWVSRSPVVMVVGQAGELVPTIGEAGDVERCSCGARAVVIRPGESLCAEHVRRNDAECIVDP